MKITSYLALGAVFVVSLLTWGLITQKMAEMKAKKAAK